jgi:hypothetical protein
MGHLQITRVCVAIQAKEFQRGKGSDRRLEPGRTTPAIAQAVGKESALTQENPRRRTSRRQSRTPQAPWRDH